MEESPALPVGPSKPHLEKLTLGITRILGEWGEAACAGSTEWRHDLVCQWATLL